MRFAVNSVLEKNPEYNYRFFNETERRNFIVKHMGKIVLDCYDKLVPNAFKADLFRLSLIYVYGGCYIDIAEVNIDSLNTLLSPETTFISVTDMGTALNIGFFCATPGH